MDVDAAAHRISVEPPGDERTLSRDEYLRDDVRTRTVLHNMQRLGVRAMSKCGYVGLLLFFVVTATAAPAAEVTDGFVKSEDGVELYYVKAGHGAQTVILPARLFTFQDLRWLAEVYSSVLLPKIAQRPLAAPLQIDEARAACDRLQSDLASIGQFAGYVV